MLEKTSSRILHPGSKQEKKVILIAIALSCFILLADQITKAIIEKYVTNPIVVIPDFFNIVKVGNMGAAWGMFQDYTWILLAISVSFFLGVLIFFRSITEGYTERYFGVALVLGGILGNSTDRIWRSGKVVDFLDFNLHFMRWPAFNVADSAICIGVGIFILSSLFTSPKNEDVSIPTEEENHLLNAQQ
jgi:signal peptidase II